MTRRGHRLAIVLLLLPAVGYVALFLVAVLLMTVLQSLGFFSFRDSTVIGFGEWAKVLDGQLWDSFAYSSRIALASSIRRLVSRLSARSLSAELNPRTDAHQQFASSSALPARARGGIPDPEHHVVPRHHQTTPCSRSG